MNNYNQHLNLPIPSSLQLLYDVMTMNASCWTPKELDDCADLAEYTGLDRDEVKLELIEIWLPVEMYPHFGGEDEEFWCSIAEKMAVT